MPTLARADLESLLRVRKLDRTLTTALPCLDPHDEQAVASSGIAPLDARLGGGFRRGHLSELVGAPSTGRTTILLTTLAAATSRGELVVVVDALDMFDVDSAASAGVDLDRLLWIRGLVVPSPGLCHELNQRALEQAVKALSLVLQAGNFGVVAFDVAGAPSEALRRLPFTTWLRLQRMVEGTQTTCLLVGNEPMARSSAGLTVVTSRQSVITRQPVVTTQLSCEERTINAELTEQDRAASADCAHSAVYARRDGRRESVGASLLFKGIEIEARVVESRMPRTPRIPDSQFSIPNRQASANVRLHLHAAS